MLNLFVFIILGYVMHVNLFVSFLKNIQIKSCGGGLCKCANERHRNDFIKYDAMMIRKQSPDTLRFLFGSLAC